eukprot:2455437-Pyramimonas_sp.AAC.1
MSSPSRSSSCASGSSFGRSSRPSRQAGPGDLTSACSSMPPIFRVGQVAGCGPRRHCRLVLDWVLVTLTPKSAP